MVGERRLAGRRAAPPPTSPAAEIVWCGARNGRRRRARRRDAGRPRCGCASPRAPRRASSGGRIDGSRRASIVLPEPGGPTSSRLCAAGGGDRQRLDGAAWPRTSARSRSARRAARARSSQDRAAAGARRRAGRGDLARGCATPTHLEPVDERGLGARSRGTDEPVEPARAAPSATASAPRHGRTSPPSDELAEDRERSSASAGIWPLGREDRARDREVEAGAGLAQVRGREVDRDAALRELEARVQDRRLHALARLAHGAVAEPDDREGGQAGAQVDLDGDAPRVEAVDREGGDAGEHGGTLGTLL